MNTPKIKQLPTETQIKQMVDKLIAPERADAEADALVNILLAVSSSESDDQYHLANVAANHAFTKTSRFAQAFAEFADRPGRRKLSAGEKVAVAGRAMMRVEEVTAINIENEH